jgi:outer membrane protein OmpA-like peptidoglycan-associated protein
MNASLRLLLPIGLATALSAGCTGLEMQSAEQARPTGSAFQSALYREYISLGRYEQGQGDYDDADHYAQKAKAAAAGRAVDADAVARRALPAPNVGEIAQSRDRLDKALDGGGRDRQPALAARAQAMLDCWMEQQEENFQPTDISSCRTEYMASMAQLESALRPQTAAAPAPAPAAAGPGKQIVVYFDTNSSKLRPDSQKAVMEAVDAAKARGVNQVSIAGYTDTAGSERHNMKLGGMRAEAIAAEMKKAGIADNLMSIGSLGQTNLAVPTPDETREPRNRRVVITIR